MRVHCPQCGCSLIGLTELRCPECGARFTIDKLIGAQGYTGASGPADAPNAAAGDKTTRNEYTSRSPR